MAHASDVALCPVMGIAPPFQLREDLVTEFR